MNKKKWIIIVALISIAILVVAGSFFATNAKNSSIFSKDTTINGDFTVPFGKEITIKNGSTITSTGDMTLMGDVSCEGGPLSFVVKGTLRVNGTLHCDTGGSVASNSSQIGLQIVATHVIFEKNSTIETSGHIIIVSDASKLPHGEDALAALYAETIESAGGKTQVGPFVDKKQPSNISLFRKEPQVSVTEQISEVSLPFIKTALASDKGIIIPASLVLGGTWTINASDATTTVGKLLFVDMGKDSTITLEEFTITGADGRNGIDDLRSSCTPHGGNGGNAFRMRMNAGQVFINNGTINLGNGGNGGNAETSTDCESGSATGGEGGEPGNIKITAEKNITITTLHIIPGMGGNGGNALASAHDGKNVCPSENGGDATALAGNGGANRKNLIAEGEVSGVAHIQIDRVIGGKGGNAVARGGNGGNSTSCECGGGNGGNGKTVGGKGGNALVSIPMSTAEGRGGDGGNTETRGGNGGNSFNCPSPLPGGNGGNAVSTVGLQGVGTTASGNIGIIKNELGGNGGNGGAGCPATLGGIGGTGAPAGTEGKRGICDTDTLKPERVQTAVAMIKAILYKGKYLPLDQIIITNEPGCGAEHFRAERGSVKATDGTIVPDADVVCGYGKISENKVILTMPEVAKVDAHTFASTTDLFQLNR